MQPGVFNHQTQTVPYIWKNGQNNHHNVFNIIAPQDHPITNVSRTPLCPTNQVPGKQSSHLLVPLLHPCQMVTALSFQLGCMIQPNVEHSMLSLPKHSHQKNIPHTPCFGLPSSKPLCEETPAFGNSLVFSLKTPPTTSDLLRAGGTASSHPSISAAQPLNRHNQTGQSIFSNNTMNFPSNERASSSTSFQSQASPSCSFTPSSHASSKTNKILLPSKSSNSLNSQAVGTTNFPNKKTQHFITGMKSTRQNPTKPRTPIQTTTADLKHFEASLPIISKQDSSASPNNNVPCPQTADTSTYLQPVLQNPNDHVFVPGKIACSYPPSTVVQMPSAATTGQTHNSETTTHSSNTTTALVLPSHIRQHQRVSAGIPVNDAPPHLLANNVQETTNEHKKRLYLPTNLDNNSGYTNKRQNFRKYQKTAPRFTPLKTPPRRSFLPNVVATPETSSASSSVTNQPLTNDTDPTQLKQEKQPNQHTSSTNCSTNNNYSSNLWIPLEGTTKKQQKNHESKIEVTKFLENINASRLKRNKNNIEKPSPKLPNTTSRATTKPVTFIPTTQQQPCLLRSCCLISQPSSAGGGTIIGHSSASNSSARSPSTSSPTSSASSCSSSPAHLKRLGPSVFRRSKHMYAVTQQQEQQQSPQQPKKLGWPHPGKPSCHATSQGNVFTAASSSSSSSSSSAAAAATVLYSPFQHISSGTNHLQTAVSKPDAKTTNFQETSSQSNNKSNNTVLKPKEATVNTNTQQTNSNLAQLHTSKASSSISLSVINCASPNALSSSKLILCKQESDDCKNESAAAASKWNPDSNDAIVNTPITYNKYQSPTTTSKRMTPTTSLTPSIMNNKNKNHSLLLETLPSEESSINNLVMFDLPPTRNKRNGCGTNPESYGILSKLEAFDDNNLSTDTCNLDQEFFSYDSLYLSQSAFISDEEDDDGLSSLLFHHESHQLHPARGLNATAHSVLLF